MQAVVNGHSKLSNPANKDLEAPELPNKQNIFHDDLNDNWNINLDRNDINNM